MLESVLGLIEFVLGATAFVLITLMAGRLLRPSRPNPIKGQIYECGEPTVGPGWVQFDLRFYVVALLFVIFDVEIAMLYPWARVFREMPAAAFFELVFFLGLLVMGYAFLWKHGYLDWVRARAEQARDVDEEDPIDSGASGCAGRNDAGARLDAQGGAR